MITRAEYLMGREVSDPINEILEVNVAVLLYRVNRLLKAYGLPVALSSGYRPVGVNANVGGSARSAHITCQAIDLKDPTGLLAAFIAKMPDCLETFDLYLEDPSATKGWVHLQTRKTASGKRVFKP